MKSLQNWKISTMLISAVLTSACIDPYNSPDNYSYFTFEGDDAFCNDIDYQFDESNMTNFECVEPVYLSFEDFQQSAYHTTGDDMKRLTVPGKLYAYESHLYSIDHLKGVAVWELKLDQTEQTDYIEIPSVSDVAIRNDYLYANSYTDLVQINLNDLDDIVRIKNVFNVAQARVSPELPDATYFLKSMVNNNNGYIIGYRKMGSTDVVLFEE